MKDLGEEFRKLSKAELNELQTEANRLNIERQTLLKTPIASTSQKELDSTSLRPSQLHRLNQHRLNCTLNQVTEHKTWHMGLGLADHVCALKPSFVDKYLGNGKEDEIHEFYKQHMAYDSKIEKNEENLPSFSRTCMWTSFGVCERDELHSLTRTLVGQFDTAFSVCKFGSCGLPFIVRLQPTSTSTSTPASSDSRVSGHNDNDDPIWIVIGSVTSRPISFTGILLYPQRGLKLGIKTIANVPCVTSLHVLFRDLVRKQGTKEKFSMQVGGATVFL